MVKLYQFPRTWDIPNLSPFCWKVENYLLMAGIEHQVVDEHFPQKGPKGKLPFIEHHGRRLGDSSFIIDYLKDVFGDPLDGELTAEKKALAVSVQRLLEDHLYWIVLWERWMTPESWEKLSPVIFGHMPGLVRMIVPGLVRHKMRGTLQAQGTGRHAPAEIVAQGKADLDALSTLLGEQAYFLGEEPTTLDATAYGFLGGVLGPPLPSKLKDYAQGLDNLVQYCQRMKERYYP